ncbi:hypothetical protein CHLRE_16g672453v5 [Chlamydomonas reinhardtii]|uniref:Uncharacterized protein n=1 Tax=Chlamydomonas reinhardtii TaxID=3055 RepID=A0A2K3CVM8_CHLRE|nr:uncharacterized protein CHLRE_16g672453v5 [Chlamydomonas reinhardtii]PNW72335.1 hypothetical protein CHLRE_16g672453v5 [Chlamydomonas reinhardtii]
MHVLARAPPPSPLALPPPAPLAPPPPFLPPPTPPLLSLLPPLLPPLLSSPPPLPPSLQWGLGRPRSLAIWATPDVRGLWPATVAVR